MNVLGSGSCDGVFGLCKIKELWILVFVGEKEQADGR